MASLKKTNKQKHGLGANISLLPCLATGIWNLALKAISGPKCRGASFGTTLWHGKIEEAKSNVKMTWSLLNETLNKKSSKQNLPIVFKSGNQELSDPAQIVEQFK